MGYRSILRQQSVYSLTRILYRTPTYQPISLLEQKLFMILPYIHYQYTRK